MANLVRALSVIERSRVDSAYYAPRMIPEDLQDRMRNRERNAAYFFTNFFYIQYHSLEMQISSASSLALEI